MSASYLMISVSKILKVKKIIPAAIVIFFSCSSAIQPPLDILATKGEYAAQIVISWKPVTGASGYRIYRSEEESGNFSLIDTTENTFFRDTSALPNKSFYYRISSISYGGFESQPGFAVSGLRKGASTGSWTVMIYLAADNNLQPNAIRDMNEMESGLKKALDAGNTGINTDIKVIVLYDGNYGTMADTRLYRVMPDSDPNVINSQRISSGRMGLSASAPDDELNMGDPATLEGFTDHCKTTFPADNYMLVLWNHGLGVRKAAKGEFAQESSIKAVCQDDNPHDYLYLDEIQSALTNSGFSGENHLNVLGFDACLMGMVEVAYEFRDLADYFIASMSMIGGYGWDYDSIFAKLYGSLNPTGITGADFSDLIVASFKNYIEKNNISADDTISAVRLSHINDLKERIDDLAKNLYNHEPYSHVTGNELYSPIELVRENSRHFYSSSYYSLDWPFYDLYDFCEGIYMSDLSSELNNSSKAVIDTLEKSVIWAYGGNTDYAPAYYGPGNSVQRGLSIFFTRGNKVDSEGNSAHYSRQYWYTSEDTADFPGMEPYGKIDFCESNSNGTVESWRELFEAWYENNLKTGAVTDFTPSSY